MKAKRYNLAPLAVMRLSSPYPTLAALAEQCELKTVSAMQQIESGRAAASARRLRLLAKALGLSLHRVEAAHLAARREYLRSEAERVEQRLREVLDKAS